MSIRKILNKKNIIYSVILIICFVFYILASKTKTAKVTTTVPLLPATSSATQVGNSNQESETDIAKFLREYQFMFWQLPNSKNSTSLGWVGDNPIVVKDNQIFDPYKNIAVKSLEKSEKSILNNKGEALIISPNYQKIINLSTLSEKVVSQTERNEFNYVWYKKPNETISVSEDKKSILIVDISTDKRTVIAETKDSFNPFSISTNNQTISFTDKEYLYIFNGKLNTSKLDKTTSESITFWLNNQLYLVEKVTDPRPLDFIMVVDPASNQRKQIIASSSMINRLNLKIRPSINQKNDLVLFSENNGLVWVLSKDQAIVRIYPELKLPPEAWSNPAP